MIGFLEMAGGCLFYILVGIASLFLLFVGGWFLMAAAVRIIELIERWIDATKRDRHER